jgi:hypothetical protein
MSAGERAVFAVLGAAVGAGATYMLRPRGEPAPVVTAAGSASAEAPAVAALGSAARAAELSRLRARVAELEAVAPGSGAFVMQMPDAKHGTSTSNEWWQSMPRDAVWDAERQKVVLERLDKDLGIKLDASKVECRTRCCRLTLPEDVFEAKSPELMSSVGLRFEPPDGYASTSDKPGTTTVTSCWSTKPHGALPDRAVERAALLAKAADALKKCSHGLAHAQTLKVMLHLDENGEIEKVDSNKDQLGGTAAACAEQALLAAAAFAPSSMDTDVPITVTLGG